MMGIHWARSAEVQSRVVNRTLRCGLRGFVGVFDHPFVSMTDKESRYRIASTLLGH
jgi:hypothetical protein